MGKIKRLHIVFALIGFFQFGISAHAHAFADSDSAMVSRLMGEATLSMQKGNYRDADVIFRKILSLKVIIPDEFCYYYGQTLLELKNYRLSESFLEKYLELTDNQGEFVAQTNTSLEEVRLKIREIENCVQCDDDGFVVSMQECHICGGDGKVETPCSRCRGRGDEVCPTCLGEGIEVLRTSFGRRYIACTTCHEMGNITCRKCDGSKVEYKLCDACRGIGKLETRKRVVD